MDIRAHHDPAQFLDLVGPLLRAERVQHTVALTVLDALCRAPDPRQYAPVLLSVHDGDAVVGAALRTPPHNLISSAIPLDAVAAVLSATAEHDPELPGFTGGEAVVDALVAVVGRPVVEQRRLRLFRLGELVVPTGVPGAARRLEEADEAAVALRLQEFVAEAGSTVVVVADTAAVVRQWRAVGAHPVLWQDGGELVSLAKSGPTVAGMSRVGPVHTPRGHRGHGYAAAATAAATQAALDAGADEVVLFTDLTNPTSNRLYPRVGFVPVADHREVRLGARL